MDKLKKYGSGSALSDKDVEYAKRMAPKSSKAKTPLKKDQAVGDLRSELARRRVQGPSRLGSSQFVDAAKKRTGELTKSYGSGSAISDRDWSMAKENAYQKQKKKMGLE
jgi:hypothetical protein